jgi:type II secretory ATPase GspE/PulE/Tfp pilus assembly ATPase PilB-like protein/ActR/RegA family two-component response regulator
LSQEGSSSAPETPVEAPKAPAKVTSVHWLARIAERAGLVGSERLEVPPDVSAEDAWGTVGRAVGVPETELAELVAEYFRLKVANFASADPNSFLLVPEAMARKHLIYPLAETDRTLVVATADPTDVEAERLLGFTSGRQAVFEVASPRAIKDAIDERFSQDKAVETLLGTLEMSDVDEDAVKLVEEMGPEEISEGELQSTPVVKLTNLIIRDGIAQGASDLHIEPGRKVGSVRYRVDGVLRKHMDLPMSALNRVISRIKILSRLDIADRLRPQDGKARVRVENLAYDLRVSTIPAGGAEKCVLRVLDSNNSVSLEDLNVPAPELARFRQLLAHRDGIVMVTGPTGSGKTSTLYGALRELADGKVNIMTVEDPIEYELASITQTQVETKQGLTFSAALRSILRQDPDVILVGEIRDRETAQTAVEAAMTGHLVLATIHANDAVSCVPRLADMGLQFSAIAATLRGALAQRLIRKVCAACAESVRGVLTPDEQRLTERHGMEPVVRAVGCPECGFTGYRGRLPVQEVLHVGPRLSAAIEARKGVTTLNKLGEQGGMRGMHEVALDWCRQAKTTLVEVERVLGGALEEEAAAAEERGPPKVLLVDDDEDARLLMRTLLEKEEYKISEAKDGHEAMDVLKMDPDFSLVVLDLQMPGMDGWEVLNLIRGSVDTAALPVMIRTGAGSSKDEAELLDMGADDFMAKSVDSARFVARVKAIIRRSLL